jgi:ribonucleoside-diphosphate reductase alpha chain
MVCLDMDHPEIVDFIEWKVREEKKAQALIAAGYPSDFNGEAYHTVSGQNSNNSVRVTDDFMRAVEADGDWQTRARTTGEVVDTSARRTSGARSPRPRGPAPTPACSTTPPSTTGTRARTRAHQREQPLLRVHVPRRLGLQPVEPQPHQVPRGADGSFDVEGYRHAVRVFFLAQEILVDYSSYPTKQIAQNSHDYRPLGLGYANLGTLLMLLGIPYDSDEGRGMAAALTAIMCGHAYASQRRGGGTKGPFAGFAKNREPMLRVMGKHRDAAYAIDRDSLPGRGPSARARRARGLGRGRALGEQYGYRNAQARCSRPRAPSACSWTATPRASSPTSRW